MTETIIDRLNNTIVNHCIAKDYINKSTISNILNIQKNKQDEIINVDFNMEKIYDIMDHISNNFIDEIHDLDMEKIDFVMDSDTKNSSVLLGIPTGAVTNNTLFYNLGPKIPIKVSYVGNLFTNIKTNIKDYGINNALVEIYICIDIHNQIIAPFIEKSQKKSYSILVASSIIQGSIPDYYNGLIELQSNLKTKNIN